MEGNTITIENGIHDIALSQTVSEEPLDFVPVSASITEQIITSDETLSFTATTTYGLVLLSINEYLDETVTPTLTYDGSATDMTANENHYYVYVPASTGNVLTATESFYNQELTLAEAVGASEINAYYFDVTPFDQAVEVTLAEISQANSAVEVLYPATIGNVYKGGIVIYIYQEGDTGYAEGETHVLVAAVEDQSSGILWYNGINVTTSAIASAVGTGSVNTDVIIVAQGETETDYAAGLEGAYNGGEYTDWLLPSKDAYNLMYQNIGQGNKLGLGNVGDFQGNCWTFSEVNIENMWSQGFGNNGFQDNSTKITTRSVPAVRSF